MASTGSGNLFEVKLGNRLGGKQFRKSLRTGGAGFFQDILKDFDEFVADLEDVVLPEEMGAALGPTLEVAQKYVPYRTGELHDSGYVDIVKKGKGGAVAEIGFGRNGQAPYALIVHEIPRYHEPPTRYKYLQTALDEDYFAILGRIAANVKRRTGL